MAGIEKIYSPTELWGHYRQNQSEFHNLLVLIAKHPNYGIYIYATCECGQFKVEVHADDIMIYDEEIFHEQDCIRTITHVYDEYLSDNVSSFLPDKDDEDDTSENSAEDEEIEIREEEIECLFEDMLIGLLGTLNLRNLDDEVVEDIREHTLEYMTRKHKIKIYRPMWLEDEDGEDFYEEYPYECMEFEDKDNPLYK